MSRGYSTPPVATPGRAGTVAVRRTNPVADAIEREAMRHREKGLSLAMQRRELVRLYVTTVDYILGQIAAIDAELAEARQAERDAWADRAEGRGL